MSSELRRVRPCLRQQRQRRFCGEQAAERLTHDLLPLAVRGPSAFEVVLGLLVPSRGHPVLLRHAREGLLGQVVPVVLQRHVLLHLRTPPVPRRCRVRLELLDACLAAFVLLTAGTLLELLLDEVLVAEAVCLTQGFVGDLFFHALFQEESVQFSLLHHLQLLRTPLLLLAPHCFSLLSCPPRPFDPQRVALQRHPLLVQLQHDHVLVEDARVDVELRRRPRPLRELPHQRVPAPVPAEQRLDRRGRPVHERRLGGDLGQPLLLLALHAFGDGVLDDELQRLKLLEEPPPLVVLLLPDACAAGVGVGADGVESAFDGLHHLTLRRRTLGSLALVALELLAHAFADLCTQLVHDLLVLLVHLDLESHDSNVRSAVRLHNRAELRQRSLLQLLKGNVRLGLQEDPSFAELRSDGIDPRRGNDRRRIGPLRRDDVVLLREHVERDAHGEPRLPDLHRAQHTRRRKLRHRLHAVEQARLLVRVRLHAADPVRVRRVDEIDEGVHLVAEVAADSDLLRVLVRGLQQLCDEGVGRRPQQQLHRRLQRVPVLVQEPVYLIR
eukprot:Rhum_TRINITY_DN14997_c8_g2::Rhum_TRINITY_DN14997_c8_g2_i1::g.131580::m.131580